MLATGCSADEGMISRPLRGGWPAGQWETERGRAKHGSCQLLPPLLHLQQPLEIAALQFGAQRIAEPLADRLENLACALHVDLVG